MYSGEQMNSFEMIYEKVKEIPLGRVSTYGRIAFLVGNPHWSRVVGYAMRACRDDSIPCHRVVKKDGTPAPVFDIDGGNAMLRILELEGVPILADGRVDIDACLW